MKTFQPTFFFLALLTLVTLLSRNPSTDNTIFNCGDSKIHEPKEHTPQENPLDLNDKLDKPLQTINALIDEGLFLCAAWRALL